MTAPVVINVSGARRLDHRSSERLRLFTPTTIIGFGLAVTLGLVLVYPHKTLEQQLLLRGDNERSDRLTVEYLKVFLKAEPKAYGLRLALATHLVGMGSFGEARRTLQLSNPPQDPAWRMGVAWLELGMREQEAFAAEQHSRRREQLEQRMREQMQVLVKMPLDTGKMIELGRKALAANAPQVAAAAFQQVAAYPKKLPKSVYAEVAAVAFGLGEYRTSAALYLHLMTQTTTLDARREYYIAGLRALQAASLFDEAIAAANQHIGPLADDTQTLLFLTRLAQAGNRPEQAQRYAKQLLRLSMLKQLPQSGAQFASYQTPAQFYWSLQQDSGPMRLTRIAATGSGSTARLLPFNEEAYSLGFNVFLANKNLVDARRLAQSAVQQQPESALWRRRLAEVSEWSAEPQAALSEWLAYARLGGDEAGWDAALRLAGRLFDQVALLEVLQHKLAVDGGNKKWLEQLLAVHESAGQPEQALALLRTRLFAARAGKGMVKGSERQCELEFFAEIAERSGADAESEAAYRLLQDEFGPSSLYALRIASHLLRLGKISESFAALRQAATLARPEDGDFWRTYAEVARMLQDDAAAQASYRKLLESSQQTPNDLTNLIALLEMPQPHAAAELAAFAYATTGKTEFAIRALNLYARTANWMQAQRFLAAIPASGLVELESTVSFLSSRAAIRQAGSDIAGAERDLRRALVLEPKNAELRAGLIWIWIASRNTADLQQALRLWQADAESGAVLWGPFAAAHMSLNRPADALRWFRKSGFLKDDYLWLMSYAECLDANAQPDLAWQIRRKAWLDLRRPEVLSNADPNSLIELRDRLAAMAPLFMDGDGGQRVMQALLRAEAARLRHAFVPAADLSHDGPDMLARLQALAQEPQLARAQNNGATLQALFDTGDPVSAANPGSGDARLSASARELALAYALSRESHDLARAWLASRFAAQLARPLWAELSLVLAADDRQQLNRLLDQVPDWLPAYDRIEAAQRAGRPALAQTFAFQQLEQVGADDEAHLRLSNLITEDPANFQTSVTQAEYAPLRVRQARIENSTPLSGGLRLSLTMTEQHFESDDASLLTKLQASDNDIEIALRQRIETGHVTASLQKRQATGGNLGLRLDYVLSSAAGLTLSGNVGMNQRATESALLRVGGMRSGIENDLTYAFGKREYARIGFGWHRYASLADSTLGFGRNWSVEAGSHLRLEYPNLTLRGFAGGSAFTPDGRYNPKIAQLVPNQADAGNTNYLPVGSTTFGLGIGLGTVIEGGYSRAWRPFLEFGLTHDSSVGRGYNASTGIAGNVFGQDMLTLRGQYSSAMSGSPQGQREFRLHYKWFY